MKEPRTRSLACFLLFIAAIALHGSARGAYAGNAPANWHSCVGVSTHRDPETAGEAAAAMAKKGMQGVPAKIVVVAAAEPLVTAELIAGVEKHFPAEIIYGCQVTSILNQYGNFPEVETLDVPLGVSVWALGGDVDVQAFSAKTDAEDEDNYFKAGSELGQALRPMIETSKRPGRLIVTFGDQYNGSNRDFAEGLNDGLGDIYPIIGAAAGNITSKSIVKGKIQRGTNVAFLLAGEFSIGQALNGGTHTPDTAEKTLEEAVSQGDGAEPFFALVFNCRRRRQGMIDNNQLAQELDAIKRHLPGVDFFGFYGPGEIGAEAPGEKAKGVGFTVVAAVLFPLR